MKFNEIQVSLERVLIWKTTSIQFAIGELQKKEILNLLQINVLFS